MIKAHGRNSPRLSGPGTSIGPSSSSGGDVHANSSNGNAPPPLLPPLNIGVRTASPHLPPFGSSNNQSTSRPGGGGNATGSGGSSSSPEKLPLLQPPKMNVAQIVDGP